MQNFGVNYQTSDNLITKSYRPTLHNSVEEVESSQTGWPQENRAMQPQFHSLTVVQGDSTISVPFCQR